MLRRPSPATRRGLRSWTERRLRWIKALSMIIWRLPRLQTDAPQSASIREDGSFWRWRGRHLEYRSPRGRHITTAVAHDATARLTLGRVKATSRYPLWVISGRRAAP